MKEIQSNRFLRKQAIYGRDLPIGDPGLPGDLREQDIPHSLDADESSSIGESEVGDYKIEYKYDYDYNENYANNIILNKAISFRGSEIITDPDILDRLKDIYEDKIREDIEHHEEDSRIQRRPDYNESEYDPMDKYDF